MPSGAEILFYVFAAIAVVSALMTISRSNPIVAAVWLVLTFFSVAVCYVLLSATFLAAIQILVYAGALMVLFVFVIMVLDVDEKGAAEHRKPARIGRIGYYLALLLGGGFLLWVLIGTLARQYLTAGAELEVGGDFGTADAMGRELFRDYLFAFEAISILLIAAVIGAVVVARSRRERVKEADAVGMADDAREAAGLEPTEGGAQPDPGAIAQPGPTPGMDFGAPSASGHDGGT